MNTKPEKIGVLIAQLGTPDDATPQAVRRYLKEFLWDKRVVDLNRIVWFFILHFIILVFRPKKSAELYQRLFEKHGPVLRLYSESLTKKLQKNFLDTGNPQVFVEYGMRYGNPSIKKVFQRMVEQENCTKILIVPMFPQYCSATTASIFDAIMQTSALLPCPPEIKFMPPFYNQPEYIISICTLIEKTLKDKNHPPQKMILSYHGIPQRYADKGDPYFDMCSETTRLIKEQLHRPDIEIQQTFQSRFGREEWLKPYTDKTLIQLAQKGTSEITIACPSFTMDCLETLDEIEIENHNLFVEHGGKYLQLVSCLNDHDIWVENLYRLIETELSSWESFRKTED